MARHREIAYTRWLRFLFCAGGAGAIALGWRGTAGVHRAGCQLPYFLSGGA
jgi:hypothetical protein